MRSKTFLAGLLCVVFFFLALFSAEGFDWANLKYSGNAVTTDELVHITGGYYYFQTHRYFINTGHPPLVKDIAALPLVIMHPVFPTISPTANLPVGYAWNQFPPQNFDYSTNLEKQDDSWDLGRVFIFNPQNNPDLIVFWSRFSVIFFNALFIFILYLIVSKAWGRRAALLGAFLLVFSQLDIAHGSLVDMDFMSSVLQMITVVFFAIYLKERKWQYSFLTGIVLALALMTKLSSLVLLPLLFLGGLIYVSVFGWSGRKIGKYFLNLAGIFVLAALLVSSVYAFQSWNMSASDVLYQMSEHFPTSIYHWVTAHIPIAFFDNSFAKGISEFFVSISMLSTRLSQSQQEIYFLGHIYGSQGAGPIYFPVMFVAKLSAGFLILTFTGALVWLFAKLKKDGRRRWREDFKKFLQIPLSFLLLVFIVLYSYLAFTDKLQLGIRYILPIIFAITLLVARFMDNYWDGKIFRNIKTKYLFLVTMIAIVLSVIFSFPNYLGYYNIFVGGTANGYNIATDSNYDWGVQDIPKLAAWLKKNNVDHIYADLPGTSYPLEYYLGNNYQNYNVMQQPLPPSGSLVAISAEEYQFDRGNSRVKILGSHLVARFGTSIFVFRVP